MVEALFDDVHGDTEPRAAARKRSPQVMKRPSWGIGLHERVDALLDQMEPGNAVAIVQRENEIIADARQRLQNLDGVIRQRNGMLAPAFRAFFRQRPKLAIEVDLPPAHLRDFHAPGTRQDEQLYKSSVGPFQRLCGPPDGRKLIVAQKYPVARRFGRWWPYPSARIGN